MTDKKDIAEEVSLPAYNKTVDAKTVIELEKKHLGITGQQPNGIAFSGGGIRSASFGLGVMQALVDNNQLEKMHYMSTASGGGYLGSALTWALSQDEKYGVKKENFPLGSKKTVARPTAKKEPDDEIKKSKPADKKKSEDSENDLGDAPIDNKLLDYIRQHSSYLIPTSRLDMVSFAGVVMRSMAIALFVYFCIMLLFMTTFINLHLFDTPQVKNFLHLRSLPIEGLFIPVAIMLLVVFLVLAFLFSFTTFFSSLVRKNVAEYWRYVNGQILVGYILKGTVICILIGSIPYVHNFLEHYISSIKMGEISSLFGSLVGVWQYIKAQKNEKSSGILSGIIITLGAVALIYGLLLLAYSIGLEYFLAPCSHFFTHRFIVLFIVTLLVGTLVNLNMVGPHRLWRARLMEAFLPNREGVKNNTWMPATEADGALMKDMCRDKNRRPYHIINTNIILVNSEKVKFRGRGGDNFIISPLFCGSDATDWKSTYYFQTHGRSKGITLGTAMATSAAALNPNAASSGEGVTRDTLVAILLGMLDLRLGYWTSNPKNEKFFLPPNFFFPGISSELMRKGLNDTNSNIQLSDGGHFENLAIYELLRRKSKLILVSDGGADPLFNFDDLSNVVEKARVDFGTKITFINPYKTDGILPGTAGDSEFQKKYSIAQRGFAIAEIKYKNEDTGELDQDGTLVYLKLAMIDGLPTDVFSYKGLNPDFPHQPTSDQFFDEKQFEAYRELGYYVAWQMMDSPIGEKLFPKENQK